MHLVYKKGIWRTKLAFRLQICSFQFTNKHLALQTGTSNYNSAKRNKVNVENGFVFIFFSQYVENKKITVKIDNKKVAPVGEFINGDGDITKSFDLSSLKKGKHTVTVSVKGFDDESVTFTK